MSTKKNWTLFSLSFIILISILFVKGHSSMVPNLKIKNCFSIDRESYIPIISTPKTKFTNNLQKMNILSYNFSYNLLWEDSQIILNESFSFPSSTNLTINNCTLFFSPPSASSHIQISIGGMSRLNISNSVLILNTDGFGSIVSFAEETYITNSTIIGLGENDYYPGLYLSSSFISVNDSKFILGYNGLIFGYSSNVSIRNCFFQNITGTEGYGGGGIVGVNSNGITVINCTFSNTRVGLSFYNCGSISILDSKFDQGGVMGINIQPNLYHSEVERVRIENNIFQNTTYGISAIGRDINILNNNFLNIEDSGLYIGGRDITVESNVFQNSSRGIFTPDSLPSPEPNQVLSSISNMSVQSNIFNNISSYCILISNYEHSTVFRIEENNFIDVGIGIGFRGNLGGSNPIEGRSWVIGNFFDNITEYAIQGFSLQYLACFQHTSFIRNAFMNSVNISFPSRYYYMDDVRWDDGFVGNYWESLIEDKYQDEDNNLIGDKHFIISIDHGQFDQAPLLSLDFLKNESLIISSHPTDLVRAKSELKGENKTLEWIIRTRNNSIVAVQLNGRNTQIEQNGSSIIVSLLTLPVGLHNISLIIQTEDQLYRDLVWVRILKDDVNIVSDVLVPFGALMFVFAIIAVVIFSIVKKRNSKI